MLACRMRVPLLRGQPFGQPLQATLDHLRIPIVAKRAAVGVDTAAAGWWQLVTLTGIGGCGKTRLAYQTAAEVLEAYPDRVWLVELAPLSEPSLVEQQLATVIGIGEAVAIGRAGPRTLTDRLVDYLAARRTLVLMDNCEHLSGGLCGAGGEAAGRLPRSHDPGHLPRTARRGWGADVRVAVAADARVSGSEQIRQVEAVQLFVDRAGLVDPSFELTADNAAAVASLCRRLDGIPLAVELAAVRMRRSPLSSWMPG
jgi:predicted ATPase